MAKRVKFQEMLGSVRRSLTAVPEHRKGRNIQYLIVQAGVGAFTVFFSQSPSFPAHQRHMEQRQGRSNARLTKGRSLRVPSWPRDKARDDRLCSSPIAGIRAVALSLDTDFRLLLP